ncbi:competence protein CoiA family protein [Cellulomonas hominis]
MSATHKAEALAQSQQGETCLVLAVDVDRDEEVVPFPEGLATGERAAFRARTSRSLRCIVSTCRAPLTAHFRSSKRSGYVHLKDTARLCDGESLAHELAKHEFAAWAEIASKGLLKAYVEKASHDRSRRPDVTLTDQVTKTRTAVEVQYSRMAAQEMRDRLADHRADGYRADIWLLGNTGDNRPDGRHRGARVNELARSLAADVTPVWFHPSTRQVLTAWSPADEHGPRPLDGTATDLYEIVALDDCRLDDRGLVTPAISRLRQAARSREEAAREAARRAEKQRARQLAAARQRQQDRVRRAANWQRSLDRAWLVERRPDRVPTRLTEVGEGHEELADRLDLTVEHWKTIVYRQMAEAVDDALTWKQLCGAVTRGERRALEPYHWITLRRAAWRIKGDGPVLGTWTGNEFVSAQLQAARRTAMRASLADAASAPVTAVAPHLRAPGAPANRDGADGEGMDPDAGVRHTAPAGLDLHGTDVSPITVRPQFPRARSRPPDEAARGAKALVAETVQTLSRSPPRPDRGQPDIHTSPAWPIRGSTHSTRRPGHCATPDPTSYPTRR